MPPYPYLATDYATQLSLFTHHNWIGGFCIVGAAAHAAIFMIRDYDPSAPRNLFFLIQEERHFYLYADCTELRLGGNPNAKKGSN